MSGLEIRIILYALGALAFGGSIAWASVTLTSHHYERVMATDRLAQDEALAEAQSKVIAAQNAQKAAETKVETEHEARTQSDADSRAAVLGSVRGLEAAVHRWRVPAAVANPGTVQAAQRDRSSDQRIEELVGRFDQSLERVIAAAQRCDNDRTAILSLEPVTP